MFRYYFLSIIIDVTKAFDRRLNYIGLNKSNLHLYGDKNKNVQTHDLTTRLSAFTRDLALLLLRVFLVTTIIALFLYFINIDSFIAVAIAATAFFIGFTTLKICLIELYKSNYKRLHFQNDINLYRFLLAVPADENNLPIVKSHQAFSAIKYLLDRSATINHFY